MAEPQWTSTDGKKWPVDPQEDVPVSEDRIWVDGCFDFAHHGHAGAMLQARQLGKELLVGVHSDEAILHNKGPTVMTLEERIAAVDACRWATKSIPHAPYVTQLDWITHYGCQYVVHGDDITSDSNGEDCYRFVKQAGRFKIVKRTPGISTTDLVGRMLLCTKTHFIRSLDNILAGEEGSGNEAERAEQASQMKQRIKDYATDETGLKPGSEVWSWHPAPQSPSIERRRSTAAEDVRRLKRRQSHVLEDTTAGSFSHLVPGKPPRKRQRLVYVDGGFDLFSSGHIAFLRQVVETEEREAEARGWYSDAAKAERIESDGEDYSPVYVIAGVHDDQTINYWKGVNYPIMNIFERGLCVLQCKYVSAVIFSAPFTPSTAYLHALPYGLPAAVYHGPTSFMPLTYDPYVAARELAIFREVPPHQFQHVNAGEIVERILKSRKLYEERQRKKGEKGHGEEAMRRRERMELESREVAEKRRRETEKVLREIW